MEIKALMVNQVLFNTSPIAAQAKAVVTLMGYALFADNLDDLRVAAGKKGLASK